MNAASNGEELDRFRVLVCNLVYLPCCRAYDSTLPLTHPKSENFPLAGAQVQTEDQTHSPKRAQDHSWALLSAAERTRGGCPLSQGKVGVYRIGPVPAVPPGKAEPGAPVQGMLGVEERDPLAVGGDGEHLGQKETRDREGPRHSGRPPKSRRGLGYSIREAKARPNNTAITERRLHRSGSLLPERGRRRRG